MLVEKRGTGECAHSCHQVDFPPPRQRSDLSLLHFGFLWCKHGAAASFVFLSFRLRFNSLLFYSWRQTQSALQHPFPCESVLNGNLSQPSDAMLFGIRMRAILTSPAAECVREKIPHDQQNRMASLAAFVYLFGERECTTGMDPYSAVFMQYCIVHPPFVAASCFSWFGRFCHLRYAHHSRAAIAGDCITLG